MSVIWRDHTEYLKFVDEAVKIITAYNARLKDENKIDGIICAGRSGTLIATPVAFALRLPILVIFHPEDRRAGGHVGTYDTTKNLLYIDDFISERYRTLTLCHNTIMDANTSPYGNNGLTFTARPSFVEDSPELKGRRIRYVYQYGQPSISHPFGERAKVMRVADCTKEAIKEFAMVRPPEPVLKAELQEEVAPDVVPSYVSMGSLINPPLLYKKSMGNPGLKPKLRIPAKAKITW